MARPFRAEAPTLPTESQGGYMTTNLKKMTPNLMVEDVNKTIAFYKDVLSFELLATVPETGQLNWAMMRRDKVEIMFQVRASITEEFPVLKDRAIGSSLYLVY